MRKSTMALLAAIATLTAAVAAHAASVPFPVTTLLANFNAITMGDFATTSEVVGPVLSGGNLSGSGILDTNGTQVPVAGAPAFTGYGEINVFGSNSGTWAETGVQHVFLGGTNTGGGSFLTSASLATNYTFPGFNSVGAGSNTATFTQDIWAPLVGFSTSLAAQTSLSTLTGTMFTGVPNANGVAVFTVPLNTLNSLTGTVTLAGCLALATPCDAVVNVTGTGAFAQDFAFPASDDITGLPNVIFNFEDATEVAWGSSPFDASILAVDATGSNNGSGFLVGNLVIGSISASAPLGNEVHYVPFDCSDNLCTPTTPVPEPGSLPLLGAALASFAALAFRPATRRRRG